jgi:hypothetical protein
MKLLRPRIPVETRCRVLLRQIGHFWPDDVIQANRGHLQKLLDRLLDELRTVLSPASDEPLHLDHDPALENRPFDETTGKYTPDANDLEHLIYRSKENHRLKTLVRGDGAQLSDAAIARKRKKSERKKSRPKHLWSSRPLRSAGRWPKERKMGSRV